MRDGTISETMTIPEIIQKFPHTDAVFRQYGINASGYKAIEYESLFATARVHHLDLNALLKDLNQAIQ